MDDSSEMPPNSVISRAISLLCDKIGLAFEPGFRSRGDLNMFHGSHGLSLGAGAGTVGSRGEAKAGAVEASPRNAASVAMSMKREPVNVLSQLVAAARRIPSVCHSIMPVDDTINTRNRLCYLFVIYWSLLRQSRTAAPDTCARAVVVTDAVVANSEY